MATPPSAASQAWTEETQVKEEEKKPFVRIIEKATGQKVKDLTKPPKNSVPYTSTAARSKKVIKMQNRYARARPVPKGAKVPGIDDEATQVPFFLPSEKPAASFFATLDSSNRKTMSEYSRTLERSADRKPNLRRQHAFIRVKSKPKDVLQENEIFESDKQKQKQKTTAHIGSNIIGDMLPVYDTFNDDFEDDLRNNNYDPSDLLTKRNVLLRKSQSMMALEKPLIKRSVSSGTSFRESPLTSKLERSGSGFNSLFTYNSSSAPRRRKACNTESITEVQSARSPEKFPIYEKREIEQSLDEIDLLLPGVCISSPRRPSTVRPSTNMKPTRTPTYCSCCSLCDTPKSQFESPTPFELDHPDLFLQTRSRRPHHCAYCQADDGKKLVQYAHGDVIKTFDWLSKNAKETPL
ncbi:uncharacterized protein LOC133196542 [Saccostrea echinata]|uniref:uncharacterized protein LOC133196542 n=1 Tax=Saccostrea echinata TaxID=191078 RepID=UPI002A7F5E2C|nr:uncharacterized protein LOC133196542 [Saccostrea echinata]